KASALPILLGLGVLFVLVVGGGIGLVFLLRTPTPSSPKPEPPAIVRGPAVVVDPGEPPQGKAQVGVLPRVKGLDPLDQSPQLKAVLAELDQTSPGWRLAEIEAKRKTLAPERNGGLYVLHADSLLSKPWPRDPDAKLIAGSEAGPT